VYLFVGRPYAPPTAGAGRSDDKQEDMKQVMLSLSYYCIVDR
jgi:hypothetical protein